MNPGCKIEPALVDHFPANHGLSVAISGRTAPLHKTCSLPDSRHHSCTAYRYQQCTLYASQEHTRRHTRIADRQSRQSNRSRLAAAYVRRPAYDKPRTQIEPPVSACLLQGHRVNAEPTRERVNERTSKHTEAMQRHPVTYRKHDLHADGYGGGPRGTFETPTPEAGA